VRVNDHLSSGSRDKRSTSCVARSSGTRGIPLRSKYAGLPQTIRRCGAMRLAINDESGSTPIRIATSMPASIILSVSSVDTISRPMSG
jgi:hypothetical protein